MADDAGDSGVVDADDGSLVIDGNVYTVGMGLSVGSPDANAGKGSAEWIKRAIANGTFSGFSKVTDRKKRSKKA